MLRAVQTKTRCGLDRQSGRWEDALLRILKTRIQKVAPKAIILLDASETPNEEIVATWKSAQRRKVSFCVAINEGVLKELADSFPAFDPVCQASAGRR